MYNEQKISNDIYSYSFAESVHNYCGVRDNKQFAKAVATAFLGEKFNDEKLKGNPWTWENESWILSDEFNVADDFPNIEVWQTELSSAVLNLCFRHRTANESRAKDTDNDNQYFEDNEVEFNNSYDDEGDNNRRSQRLREDQMSERRSEMRGRDVMYQDKEMERAVVTPPHAFEVLRNAFPDTHISVYISESIRNIERNLVAAILSRYRDYRGTNMYVDNKTSFNALLQILSSPTEEHHNLVCDALRPLPVKENDLYSCINNLNHAIRLLHHHGQSPCKSILYILIHDELFDNSQQSHK